MLAQSPGKERPAQQQATTEQGKKHDRLYPSPQPGMPYPANLVFGLLHDVCVLRVLQRRYRVQRKPMSKYRPSGAAPARLAARALATLLFQEPPLMARFSPDAGPLGFCPGETS